MSSVANLLAALLDRAEHHPHERALLQKLRGKWVETNWQSYAQNVADVAEGLQGIGVSAGQVVLLVMDNRPALAYLDFATQSLGGVTVLVPPETRHDDVRELVGRLRPSLVVIQDIEWVDALLPAVPTGTRMVHVETAGIAAYDDDRLLDYDSLRERGAATGSSLAALRSRAAACASDGVATLSVSTGAHGRLRTFSFTHGQLLAAAQVVLRRFPLKPGEFVLSQVSLGVTVERALSLHSGVLSGAVVAFPENSSVAAAAATEILPHFVHAPTTLLENLVLTSRQRLERNRGVKRLLARAWLRSQSAANGTGGLLHNLVGRFIVRQLGLSGARVLVVSDVSVTGSTRAYLQALRLPVVDAYTVAACAVPVLLTTDVGAGYTEDVEGLESEISQLGRLRIRGPLISNEAVTTAGWYDTGDAAERDGNAIVIHGPATLCESVGSVRRLSLEITASKFIRRADIAELDARIHLLIEIDTDAIGVWAREEKIKFRSVEAVVDDEQVQQLIAAEVRAAIGRLGVAVRLGSTTLLRRPLSAAADNLTVTGKLRVASLDPLPDGVALTITY